MPRTRGVPISAGLHGDRGAAQVPAHEDGWKTLHAPPSVTLMTEEPTWIDIQAVGTHRDAQVRVRRYRRTSRPPDDVVLPTDLHTQAEAATVRLSSDVDDV